MPVQKAVTDRKMRLGMHGYMARHRQILYCCTLLLHFNAKGGLYVLTI